MSAYDPWQAPAGWGPGYPAAPRPAKSPRAGWYALPASLLVLAVVLVVAVVAAQWDELNAADDGESAGPNTPGVSMTLVRDYPYEVFVEIDPTESAAPGGGGMCVLTPTGGSPTAVAVGGERGSFRENEVARSGVRYRYLGEFPAPLSGRARISCAGWDGRLLVRPDDRPFVVLGVTVLAAGVLGLLALVAFVVVIMLRSRRPRQPPYQPYGQYGPYQPYGPYPG